MQQVKQQQKDVNNLYTLIYFGIYSIVILALSFVFGSILSKTGEGPGNTGEFTVLSLILMAVILTFAFIWRKEIFKNKSTALIAGLTFAVAGMVQNIMNQAPKFAIWLIFTVFLSYALNHYLGLLYAYYFLAQSVFFLDISFSSALVLFIIATVLNIGGAWAGNFFPLSELFNTEHKEENNNTIQDTKSDDMETGVAYLQSFAESLTYDSEEENMKNMAYSKNFSPVGKTEEPLVERVTTEEEETVYPDENMELVQEFRKAKKSVYIRSLRTAVFAEEVTEHVGFDSRLARAIAVFREIGRLNGNENYIEDTVAIAKANNFPDKLVKGLEEVNRPKGSKICNAEAAIVAITGDIIKTYYFLKTNGSPYNTDKIVDTTVTKYVVNGMIDNSGLSVKNISEIRVYFVEKLRELEDKA